MPVHRHPHYRCRRHWSGSLVVVLLLVVLLLLVLALLLVLVLVLLFVVVVFFWVRRGSRCCRFQNRTPVVTADTCIGL